MGHQVSGVIVRGPVDREAAGKYDMRLIELEQGCILIALDAAYLDHWEERLGLAPEAVLFERPTLNTSAVHQMAHQVTNAPFVIFETDYVGGPGDQAAAAYDGERVLMPPTVGAIGPINRALRLIGVTPRKSEDEFAALGLGRFRSFEGAFREYWSPEI